LQHVPVLQATPVEPKDNLIGLSITSVKKSGNDYIIRWDSSNAMISNVIQNQTQVFSLIYYIDPEKYENHYQPFTIGEDGWLTLISDPGDEISRQVSRIKLEPSSKVMYVYFKGVKEPAPAALRTAPLFFTIVLGDEPFVLEQTPRYAGTMFDEALK